MYYPKEEPPHGPHPQFPAGRCCGRPAGRRRLHRLQTGPAGRRRRRGPASDPADAPRHLQGVPLAGPTGLRLLVASDPPRLLDVDRGTSRPVGGIPAGQDPFSVFEVGRSAVVAGDRQVFVLRRGASRATPVGRGGQAVGSLDGRGVWLLEHGRRCTLREVSLDGRARRPARRVPCTIGLLADTPLGLLAWTEPGAGGEGTPCSTPAPGLSRSAIPRSTGWWASWSCGATTSETPAR